MRTYVTQITQADVIATNGLGAVTQTLPIAQALLNYIANPLFVRLVYSVGGNYVGFDHLDDLSIPAGFDCRLLNAIKFNSSLYRKSDKVISTGNMITNINNADFVLPLLNAPAVDFTLDIYVFKLIHSNVLDVNIAQTWWGDLQDERVPVDINSASTIGLSTIQVYNHK